MPTFPASRGRRSRSSAAGDCRRCRANAIYQKKLALLPFAEPSGIAHRSRHAGARSLEYKTGWDGWSGTAFPPIARTCGRIFYNYYLNAIRDVRTAALQRDRGRLRTRWICGGTPSFVFTADHGEMGGGPRRPQGQRPVQPTKQNAHVPLLIAHPAGKPGGSTTGAHQPSRPSTDLCRSDRAAGDQPSGHGESAAGARFLGPACRARESRVCTAVRPGVLFNYMGVEHR